MSGIQGISGQPYIGLQPGRTPKCTKTEASKAKVDQFSSSGAMYDQVEEKSLPFTAEMAAKLAPEYDVQSMSRNAYTKLLAQLRSSGILTGQEYSAAYGGTMPAHEQAISWPHGNETTDFMLFLQKCGQQCDHAIESGNYSSDEERRNCELLTSVYSKLNGIFQQIHSAKTQAGPDTKASAQTRVYSDEFNRLYEQLKQDKNYAERVLKKPGGNFDRRNPVRVQLMKEYLLSNDGLLEDYAKHTWISNAEHNARLVKWNAEHPNRKLNGFYDMPSDYTGYVNEFKHTLRHGSTEEIFNLCNDFENTFLSRKFVKTQRLTEEERFLFPDAANYERGHWQNFNEGMSSVENEIREEFDRAGFSLDIDREYQFYLNTENFSFSVKGGTEEENRLIESVINRNPGEGYVFNPLKTTIYALYFHRQPDLSFTPWRAGHLSAEDMGNYGIANIPESYTKKMGQYLAAYRRSEMNRNLQCRFGFGIDDISYVNGHWQGSTDEITQMIEKMNQDGTWDKQIGDAYRNLMKEYTGTPVFQEPVFVFRNGEFHVTYEKPVIQENQ